ncbi:SsrA-binding protein SmpB [Candidatus Parcubacteria bacterium]|jgi:SsrA-binding protein|nr:MAG: SsrA-binding protein SmpB [Candidatus Parcubacteria bacterium]
MPQLTKNRKANFNYDVLEKYEAGIVLTGPEVKSVKAGNLSLQGAYVSLRENSLWLVHAFIAPYKPARTFQTNYNPERERRLLLTKNEISGLVGKMHSAGLTLIPLSFYTQRGLVKVALGLARGKKAHDKRASIKKREIARDIGRALRNKI